MENIISRYFHEGLQYTEIVILLRERHGITIGVRQLHRILRSLGLRRRSYSDIKTVIDFILREIQTAGRLHGYRTMRQRCLENGLYVRTHDVATILRVCDRTGVEERTVRRFVRRSYFAPGPNFIWHIDGYDKLKPYGLCIHGCICGFSRKIIWLAVYFTNNNPRIVAGYFLDAVERNGGTPRVIRGDFGTENVLVRDIQRWFRRDNSSYIEGASTQNQRIESWWGYLRRQHMQYWIDIMKDMQDTNEYSGSELDKNLVQFCFMALIHAELDLAASMWNNHTIRRSHNMTVPCGQPSRLFNYPELWNCQNHICPVPVEEIDACRNLVQLRSPVCCDADIYSACIDIMTMDDFVYPSTADEAMILYRHLRARINTYI